MITSLTQTDVLRYVYSNTDHQEDKTVYEAILKNEQIANEFVLLSEAKTLLAKCSYSASNNTLQNILEYASSKKRQSI